MYICNVVNISGGSEVGKGEGGNSQLHNMNIFYIIENLIFSIL